MGETIEFTSYGWAMMLYLLLIFLFSLSAYATHFYIRYAWHHQVLDIPNARSAHTHLTPRGGGIVFLGLWIAALLVAFFLNLIALQTLFIILPGVVFVATVGFCDDCYQLPARWRALAYLLAAILSISTLGGWNQFLLNENIILPLGMFGSVFAVLLITWSTNLFNFMDGLDGLAASEAIFILTLGGFFLAQVGGESIALSAWLLSAGIGGFWIWNTPPARVFMGDVGSTALGFIMMLLAFWGEKQYGVPALLWFILYGVFLVDATLTLIRRIMAKEAIYQAHKLHAYQRLYQAGYSHAKVLILISSVNGILGLLAVYGFYARAHLLLCACAALFLLLACYAWVERIKPMYASPVA
jgi:Fuc2NAc and GlcNAc transferase